MYLFYFVIGDCENMGHGKYLRHLVISNVPIQYVRDAHRNIRKEIGIDIEHICSSYGEDLLERDVLQKIHEQGFQFGNNADKFGELHIDDMVRLWLFLMKKADSCINLELVDMDCIPPLQYHSKLKEENIGNIGYGLLG